MNLSTIKSVNSEIGAGINLVCPECGMDSAGISANFDNDFFGCPDCGVYEKIEE